jgi:ankyrin repeat protein
MLTVTFALLLLGGRNCFGLQENEKIPTLNYICDPIIAGEWNHVRKVVREIGSFKNPKYFQSGQLVIGVLCQYAGASDRYANALTGIRILHEIGADARGQHGRAMFTAASMDNWGQITERLIQYGVKPNDLCGGNLKKKGGYPIMIAVVNNKGTAACEVLLRYGADPNIFQKTGPFNNLSGKETLTPLMAAAANGKRDFVKVLIKYKAKADLKCPESGMTALHFAAKGNQPEIIPMLLKAGADKRIRDKQGQTPLQVARKAKAFQAIKLLS